MKSVTSETIRNAIVGEKAYWSRSGHVASALWISELLLLRIEQLEEKINKLQNKQKKT